MNFSESMTKIATALSACQTDMPLVGKGGTNSYDKYDYARLEDFVRAANPILSKHKIAVVTSTEELIPLEDRTTKSGGTEHAVRVRIAIRAVHESGEWAEVEMIGEGQDRADKGIYKAVTGARKYAIAMLFGLATSDDPESDEKVGNATAAPGQSPPTRPVAPKPANGVHRQRMMSAAAKWSGVQVEDVPAVCQNIAAIVGVTLSKATTEEEFARVADQIEANIAGAVPFMVMPTEGGDISDATKRPGKGKK